MRVKGWRYLASIKGLFTGEVVGPAMNGCRDDDGVGVGAITKALTTKRPVY